MHRGMTKALSVALLLVYAVAVGHLVAHHGGADGSSCGLCLLMSALALAVAAVSILLLPTFSLVPRLAPSLGHAPCRYPGQTPRAPPASV